MAVRTSITAHPIHMLVPIPIGLFLLSLVADVVARDAGLPWPAVALYCIGGGILGALLAAVFGLISFTDMAEGRVKRLARVHSWLSATVILLFSVGFALRWNSDADVAEGLPMAISVLGLLLVIASGWLGGLIVFVYGAGARQARP